MPAHQETTERTPPLAGRTTYELKLRGTDARYFVEDSDLLALAHVRQYMKLEEDPLNVHEFERRGGAYVRRKGGPQIFPPLGAKH